MKILQITFLVLTTFLLSCDDPAPNDENGILGFELLSEINGHWVGTNQTGFGFFDWFTFDFRPISGSHSHSIYEGATNQNIINSVFVADYEGEKRILARNGGWLGTQYRATYFILDIAEPDQEERYYRLVDAIGGEDRAFIEFRFRQDSIFFDAYKDNSGALDKPFLHMSFKGSNRNRTYSEPAVELFNFPTTDAEVGFPDGFQNLVDPDSALYLEESEDPFPKSDHGHISDLVIDILRNSQTANSGLLLYISKGEIVSSNGLVDFDNLDNSVVRTIDINNSGNQYTTTYLHPDDYYITIFSDEDANGFPSSGDPSSISVIKKVDPELIESTTVEITLLIQ